MSLVPPNQGARTKAGAIVIPLSEPLSLRRLCRYWRCRHRIAKLRVESIDGAEQVGSMWMVPVDKLPVTYWADAGLLDLKQFSEGRFPALPSATGNLDSTPQNRRGLES